MVVNAISLSTLRLISLVRLALAVTLVLSMSALLAAQAETINIVALGDSNTFGSGLGRTPGGVPVAEAYPAKLERALRARGWDVSVSNQGVPGYTARDAIYTLDRKVAPGTKLTIVELGLNDRNLNGASPPDIARTLTEIIRRIQAKGSAVIVIRHWPQNDDAFAAVQRSADVVVSWYSSLYNNDGFGPVRPEYDSGDHAHVNAAGTDVIVSLVLPDVERVLRQIGSRVTR
jgi:acyl-CoA thioesterase-1